MIWRKIKKKLQNIAEFAKKRHKTYELYTFLLEKIEELMLFWVLQRT